MRVGIEWGGVTEGALRDRVSGVPDDSHGRCGQGPSRFQEAEVETPLRLPRIPKPFSS